MVSPLLHTNILEYKTLKGLNLIVTQNKNIKHARVEVSHVEFKFSFIKVLKLALKGDRSNQKTYVTKVDGSNKKTRVRLSPDPVSHFGFLRVS